MVIFTGKARGPVSQLEGGSRGRGKERDDPQCQR